MITLEGNKHKYTEVCERERQRQRDKDREMKRRNDGTESFRERKQRDRFKEKL